MLVLVLVTAGTIEEEILDKAKQKREIDAKVIQAGMFNDHSTHEQRQAVLRAIMSRGAGAVADAVHDEGEVNEMLARTPEELERFIEMDEQWHAAHPGKSRLMTEEEVPSWVLQQEGGGEEEEGGGGGKRGGEDAGGRRLRKRRRTGGYADDAALLDAYVWCGAGCRILFSCGFHHYAFFFSTGCLRVMKIQGVMSGPSPPGAHDGVVAHRGDASVDAARRRMLKRRNMMTAKMRCRARDQMMIMMMTRRTHRRKTVLGRVPAAECYGTRL